MAGGVAVWARTGVAVNRIRATNRIDDMGLGIIPRYLMTDFEIIQAVWVNFENIFGSLFRDVGGVPAACQDFINHSHVGIDPDHSQIEPDEEHVNGRIDAAIMSLDQ